MIALYNTLILPRTPSQVPQVLADTWAANIQAAFDDTFTAGWAEVLDTESTFLAQLAEPAIRGYADVLTPGVRTRRGLTGLEATKRHGDNLKASYDKLVAAIEALTTAGRDDFLAKIIAAKPEYRKGERWPLPLTGAYLENLLGAAVRQWFWLARDQRYLTFRQATDVAQGVWPPVEPYLIDVPQWDVARAHQNLLVQAGVLVQQHASLKKVHARLDEWLETWLSDFYMAPPSSWIRVQPMSGGLGLQTVIRWDSHLPNQPSQEPVIDDIDLEVDVRPPPHGGFAFYILPIIPNIFACQLNPFESQINVFAIQTLGGDSTMAITGPLAILRPSSFFADVIVIPSMPRIPYTINRGYLGYNWAFQVEGEADITEATTRIIYGEYAVYNSYAAHPTPRTWRVTIHFHPH